MADFATSGDQAVTHCTGCGRPLRECAGCGGLTDTPHYCGKCGTWLAVQVRPVGWKARCKIHGETSSNPIRAVG